MTNVSMPRVWCQLPEGRLPEDHPLVAERVSCEECGALCKNAGTRDSVITWVETGWWLPIPEEDKRDGSPVPMEQQNYCVLHFGGHKGVYPTLDPKYLLKD